MAFFPEKEKDSSILRNEKYGFVINIKKRVIVVEDIIDLSYMEHYQLQDIYTINNKKLVFTMHARERFKERFSELAERGEELLPILFAGAKEDTSISNKTKVTRILDNNFTPALYLRNGNIRFVAKEEWDKIIVITIEPSDKERFEK